MSQGRRVRIEAGQRPADCLAGHTRDALHLPCVVFHDGAQERLGRNHADEPALLDDGELGEVVVALQPGALLGGSVHGHRRDNGHRNGLHRHVVVRQSQVYDVDLADEQAIAVGDKDVRELPSTLTDVPESVPCLLGKAVHGDCWGLGCHERAGGVRLVGEDFLDLRLGKRLLKGFCHPAEPQEVSGQERQADQRRQGLLWAYLADDEGEHTRAHTCAETRRLYGVHLLEHPDDGVRDMTRSMVSRLARGSPAKMLAMSAGCRRWSSPRAACSWPALIRPRTSPAISPASARVIALGGPNPPSRASVVRQCSGSCIRLTLRGRFEASPMPQSWTRRLWMVNERALQKAGFQAAPMPTRIPLQVKRRSVRTVPMSRAAKCEGSVT